MPDAFDGGCGETLTDARPCAGARVFADRLRGIVRRQQRAAENAGRSPESLSELFRHREVRRALVLIVGADKGLCGAYNVSLGRHARAFLEGLRGDGVDVELIAKGSRVARYLRRTAGVDFADTSEWTREGVTDAEVDRLLGVVLEAFRSGRVDAVWACHTAFLSTVRREPTSVRLLPIAPETDEPTPALETRWFYEPAQEPCVDELLEALVRTQVEAVLLEAFASEQAARMVTMQEASERADRTLADLQVRYNRLRRESITSDLVGVLVAGRLRRGVGHGA